MQLQALLKAHSRFVSRGALKDNFGDGYLLAKNPLYRAVRNQSLKAGVKFSSKRFFDFEVLPLTQLPRILSKKTIPYSRNVNALIEIERAAPRVFSWDEVPPLKSNFILHESSHVLARELRPKALGGTKKKKMPVREMVLNALIEESFANTVECMAGMSVQNETHEIFFVRNSYIVKSQEEREIMRVLQKQVGSRILFRVIFGSYLHSNFLRTNTVEDDFANTMKFILAGNNQFKITLDAQSKLREAFHLGLNLDPGFTIFTNSFCFRLMGLKDSIYDYLAFDFMAMLTNDERYRTWIDSLQDALFS